MKKFFVFAIAVFSFWACNNDDDDTTTVASSVPLYQNYRVEYNLTKEATYASANFNKVNANGESVQLSGTSSIRFNGQNPAYTGSGPYLYNFTFPANDDIEFALTRKAGEVYTNTVTPDDIAPVNIVKDFTTISIQDGTTFVWFGQAVGQGETVQVRVVTSSGEYDFHTSEVGSIAVDIQLPPTVSPGSAQFYLSRIKTLDLQQDDKGAGGQIQVLYTVQKEVTLQ